MNDDKIIRLGIDLDETMINNRHTHEKSNYNIKDGVIKWFPPLNQTNRFEFHCITARREEHSFETFRILDKIEMSTGIKFASRSFTEGQAKGKIAADLGCSVMIDDWHPYLSNCIENGVTPILLGRFKDKRLYPDWKVFVSWQDIHEYLIKTFA